MPIIDVGTQPSDGENADAADINGQINAILAVVNGHLDGDNFGDAYIVRGNGGSCVSVGNF